jgi:hypothetical protein
MTERNPGKDAAAKSHKKVVTHSPGDPTPADAEKRPRYRLKSGGGPVPQRMPVDALEQAKPRFVAGTGTPHPVKFSGGSDAQNAHADADHGAILFAAQVRVIFWGKEWQSSAPPLSMAAVTSDVQTILDSSYLDGLEQYAISSVNLGAVIQATDEDPPNPVSTDDVGDLVSRLIDNGRIPQADDDTVPAINMVFLPSQVEGTTLTVPPGLAGEHAEMGKFDWGNLVETDVYFGWVSNNGTRGNASYFFSHELVEALTDPDGSGWQVEPRNGTSWHEICDVCGSAMMLNGVRVTSYWSNEDNSCIVTDSSFTTFTVTWIWRPERIEWFGGVDQDGNDWQFPRLMVMNRIRNGDVFKVDGRTSGKDSKVGIYYLDPTHPYLATNEDGVPDDNLLSLPQRKPS